MLVTPEQDERLDIAIIDNETGRFFGEVGPNDFDTPTDSCGFRIAPRGPARLGWGFDTEATRLIVAHGLDSIRVSSISLEVLTRIPRAHHLRQDPTRHGPEFDGDCESCIQMMVASQDGGGGEPNCR